MRVRELLRHKSGNVITIRPDTSVGEATRLLMQHGIGGLPVVAPGGSVAGLLSERDVVRAVHQSTGTEVGGVPVERVMQRPAPTCSGDASLHDIMREMTRERHRHLVVLEGAQIAGVVSVGDLVKHRLEQLELETGVLRDYVAAQRASS